MPVADQRPRRSGRPYRPPEDDSRPDATLPDRQIRTAWLLGTTRMLAAGGAFAQRRAFVEAMAAQGVPCDESRVSRWESGALGATDATVAGYERVLGLPAFSLRGAADLVRRPGRPAYGLLLEEGDEHARLDELTESALAGEASGLAWLELAERMDRASGVYLREAEWQTLARGLVLEQCRSVELGFVYRTAALARMISNRNAQRHVVQAIGALVLDSRVLRRADALRMLGHIPGARTSALTLRLMESADEQVRHGAAQALAGLIADGGFDSGQLAELEAALVRLLRADGSHQLADLAARLPDEVMDRVQRRAQSPAVEQVVKTYELVSPGLAVGVARRLAATAQSTTPWWEGEPDAMLVKLCREALFHSHGRRRRAAHALLGASPYRSGLAEGAAALLDHPDDTVVRQAARLIAWTGSPQSTTALTETAARHRAPLVRRAALTALGNAPDPLPPSAIAVAHAALAGPPAVREAAAYTLGMHGLADTGEGPELEWWREQGPRLAE